MVGVHALPQLGSGFSSREAALDDFVPRVPLSLALKRPPIVREARRQRLCRSVLNARAEQRRHLQRIDIQAGAV